jgi:hypothetical protein
VTNGLDDSTYVSEAVIANAAGQPREYRRKQSQCQPPARAGSSFMILTFKSLFFHFLLPAFPAAQLLKASHALMQVKIAHTPCLPASSAGWLAGFDLDISH